MTKNHVHRPKESRDICFCGPVAQPENRRAHGNICRIDTCSCGAERLTNINCGEKERGPWTLVPHADET